MYSFFPHRSHISLTLGKASFDVFSHKKPVLVKSSWFDFGLLSDPFFLYPPHTPLKLALIRFVAKFM